MRDIAIAIALFDVTFGTVLFLSTVVKWYMLKAKIEGNGWESMNPCEVMTLLIYSVPVFGPMSFLALMTTLDEGAVTRRTDADSVITVAVGPMRFVFAEEGRQKNGDRGTSE